VSEAHSPPCSADAPTIVPLVGDLDLSAHSNVRRQLDEALAAGQPVVIDLGDCTFLNGDVVQMLVRTSIRAKAQSLGFVVVLPFSANALVRRLLLEVLPDHADFPIAPTVRAATGALANAQEGRNAIERWRLPALRASLWETAAQLEALRARPDVLRLEQRRTLDLVREGGKHRRGRGLPRVADQETNGGIEPAFA